jgi:hypothetical protein
MFNRGQRLTNGLIDESRLFQVMNKVKGMANQSKMINYREVCAYTNEIEEDEACNDKAEYERSQSPVLEVK